MYSEFYLSVKKLDNIYFLTEYKHASSNIRQSGMEVQSFMLMFSKMGQKFTAIAKFRSRATRINLRPTDREPQKAGIHVQLV